MDSPFVSQGRQFYNITLKSLSRIVYLKEAPWFGHYAKFANSS